MKADRFSIKKPRALHWLCDEDSWDQNDQPSACTHQTYDMQVEENGLPFKKLCAASENNTSTQFQTYEGFLQWAVHLLSHSPLMHALIQNAQTKNWRLKLTDIPDGGYHLDTQSRTLMIDHSGLSLPAMAGSAHLRSAILTHLMHGLRDIYHADKLQNAEHTYTPEDVLLLERIRSADSDLMAVMGAWELRAHGHAELWRHLLSGEDGDLALIFACAIEKSPASLFDGTALSQAFDQWFEDSLRVDAADYSALDSLDGMLADAQTLGDIKITAQHIKDLSTLPDGRAYLQNRAENILKDPAYAGLNDPINQAHLFQIVYDSKVTLAGGVPFRDQSLARKLFPSG